MIEVTFLIPRANNAGESFDSAHNARFEAFLLAEFDGFTLMPLFAAGGWAGEAGPVVEDNRIYIVAIPSLCNGEAVRRTAEYARAHYSQEAIYFRYLGLSECYPPPKPQPLRPGK